MTRDLKTKICSRCRGTGFLEVDGSPFGEEVCPDCKGHCYIVIETVTNGEDKLTVKYEEDL